MKLAPSNCEGLFHIEVEVPDALKRIALRFADMNAKAGYDNCSANPPSLPREWGG
jgi:hypothetical protein